MFISIEDRIVDLFGDLGYDFLNHTLVSVVIIVFFALLRKAIVKMGDARLQNEKHKYYLQKYSMYVTVVLISILIMDIWLDGFKQIWTLLGLVAAGLVLAMKEPILNFVGRIFIAWRSSFKIGDRIQIGSHIGDVIDLGMFQFQLMELNEWTESDQYTGRILTIPNANIFTMVKANYSDEFPYIWNEVKVKITFESNRAVAKEILANIAHNFNAKFDESQLESLSAVFEKYDLLKNISFESKIFTKIVEDGIEFSLRYFCDIYRRRATEHDIYEAIANEFGKRQDIQFAYRTTRFFDNSIEGKLDAKKL